MTDFTMTRGDSHVMTVSVLNSDGTAQDLTDVDLWFTAKRRHSDSDDRAILAYSTDLDGIEITDAAAGLAEVTIEAGDTADLPGNRTVLVWDLQGVDGAGTVITLAQGKLRILADVTQTVTAGS